MSFNLNRIYNFDGSTPFVNPVTGQSDLSEMFYNGKFLNYDQITNSGVAPWITKVNDGGAQATRFQVNPTDAQIYSWRSQMSSFPGVLYKHYRSEFEFKLDPSWDMNMGMPGYGIIAQSQSASKPGQANSAHNLNIRNNILRFEMMYPKAALSATTWPTNLTWTNADYAPTNFQDRTITSGRYYKVRMEYFADDRPPQFGGQGYMNIWLDDVLWIQYIGPTMFPDQLNNGDWRYDFGWYNWGGQPTSSRNIYFKTSHVYVRP